MWGEFSPYFFIIIMMYSRPILHLSTVVIFGYIIYLIASGTWIINQYVIFFLVLLMILGRMLPFKIISLSGIFYFLPKNSLFYIIMSTVIFLTICETREGRNIIDWVSDRRKMLMFKKMKKYKYLYRSWGDLTISKTKLEDYNKNDIVAYKGEEFCAILKDLENQFQDAIVVDEKTLQDIVDNNLQNKEDLVALML